MRNRHRNDQRSIVNSFLSRIFESYTDLKKKKLCQRDYRILRRSNSLTIYRYTIIFASTILITSNISRHNFKRVPINVLKIMSFSNYFMSNVRDVFSRMIYLISLEFYFQERRLNLKTKFLCLI